MSRYPFSCTLLITLCLLSACSSDDDGDAGSAPLFPTDGEFEATVRRTAGGAPHVRAPDLASVAFGAGYAQAEDNASA